MGDLKRRPTALARTIPSNRWAWMKGLVPSVNHLDAAPFY